MKSYSLVFFIILLPHLSFAGRCESYFEGLNFENKLKAMGVKYILEKEDSFDTNETVAVILPDTETYLGRQALELIRYPVPTSLRVGRYTSILNMYHEMSQFPHAFYAGRSPLPIPYPDADFSSQVVVFSDSLTVDPGFKILLKHEMEHANLKGKALVGNASVMVSLFLRSQPSARLFGTKIDVEEAHVYSAHVKEAIDIAFKESLTQQILDAIYHEKKMDKKSKVLNFETLLISGSRNAYSFAHKIIDFYSEIETTIQKNEYKLKLKNNKTWAIFTLTDGIDFYMPVNEIHPTTHSKSQAHNFVLEQFQRFKALIHDYKEMNDFLITAIDAITEGHISREQAPEFLAKVLRMYRLPDRIDSPNRKPISSRQLIKEALSP